MGLKLLVAAAFLAAGATLSLPAETITFSNQPLTDGTPFVQDCDGGFTVIPYSGEFMVGQRLGKAAPDLFDYDSSATLEFKQDEGDDFFFDSVDLATFGNGAYTFTGLLDGAIVYTNTHRIRRTGTFGTYRPSTLSAPIDTLLLTLSGPVENDLDNVVVRPVASTPEPASLLLLATGLFGVGRLRSRTKPQ